MYQNHVLFLSCFQSSQLIEHSPCPFFFPKYSSEIKYPSLVNSHTNYLLKYIAAVTSPVTPNMYTKVTDFLNSVSSCYSLFIYKSPVSSFALRILQFQLLNLSLEHLSLTLTYLFQPLVL